MGWVDAFQEATARTIPATLVRQPRREGASFTADELNLPERMDGDGPLVSVVTPTYGDSHFLPDALESIGAQTHRNLELLIVDASGVEWVEQLADDREWIRYLLQDSVGISAARNDAIEAAAGEFVALLDADDYWHPEKLERQLAALDNGKQLSYCATYVIDLVDEGSVWCRDLNQPSEAVLDRVNGTITAQPSTLVLRRDRFSHRPFDETLDACEDFLFLIEAFAEEPPAHVPDLLCVYRNRGDSITADTNRMYAGKRKAIDRVRAQYPELSESLDRCLAKKEYGIGRRRLEANDRRSARGHLWACLRSNPSNYKAWALLLASLVPAHGARSVRAFQTVHDKVHGKRGQSRPTAMVLES